MRSLEWQSVVANTSPLAPSPSSLKNACLRNSGTPTSDWQVGLTHMCRSLPHTSPMASVLSARMGSRWRGSLSWRLWYLIVLFFRAFPCP